ncbi:hypothetical protein H5410_042183 [Solanum commersonii]|uniref:Uncharacterized protein n=1 Tax=Solanum commersonii TaxID=4109 RepID=A0A9J5XV01_SOLCO|nr:hypothetical protein H5410_042183 [Solanum commersonii]
MGCLIICVAEDHSAQLVRIADTLGNPSTVSRNCSVTRRLLLFIADLTFSFRVQHTGTKDDLQVNRRLANKARQSSGLHSFVLFIRLIPSCQVMSMFCLKIQIPET